MKRQRLALLLLIVVCVMATGCGRKKAEYAKIKNDSYVKDEYSTVEVTKGTLNPEFKMRLQGEDYKKENYKVEATDLELDKLYVSLGDKVKKGDLLVSFKCEELQKTIDDYTEQVNQNELLAEHYKKIMQIDSSQDYKADIEMLDEDNSISKLYIEDAKEKLASYQITAKMDGTITFVSDYLLYGYYSAGENMISEVGGSGNYTVTTQKVYDFEEGQEYTAVSGILSYQLKISKIKKQTNDEGTTTQILTFEPISDMSSVSDVDILEINIVQPVLNDVLYIEADAVQESDNGFYVYTVDDDGYRDAVPVTVGDKVGEYIVITSGLTEGEKVSRY